MKLYLPSLLLLVVPLFLANCSTTAKKMAVNPSPEASAKALKASEKLVASNEDEYATKEVADPLESLNRATFKLNDGLYTVIFRPISKGYEMILPKPVRKGIDNAFDNIKFPVRFVNSTLQGKFKRAGQETGKFFVNTVAGFGGILRQSDRIPSLTDLPSEDTGQTFAKWGIGHGPYIVLPLLGPSSLRETVGLAGDYALNPVNWGFFWSGKHDWTLIPPSANTLRSLPGQLSVYDAATKDSVDPYLSARSAYMQNRAEEVRR